MTYKTLKDLQWERAELELAVREAYEEDDILAAEKLMDELNKVNDYIERLEKGE